MTKFSLYLMVPFVIGLLFLLLNTHYKWLTQKDVKEIQRDFNDEPILIVILTFAFLLWPLTIILVAAILFYKFLPNFFPKEETKNEN